MRALFVNAEPSVAHAISLMLRTSGIVTDHVRSGQEAAGVVRRRNFDVILLDLALRNGDAFEVLDLLHRNCRIPILALGTCAQGQESVRALHAGAADYLARPFDRSELVDRLRAITGHEPVRPPVSAQPSMFHRTQVARTGAFGTPLPSSAAWD